MAWKRATLFIAGLGAASAVGIFATVNRPLQTDNSQPTSTGKMLSPVGDSVDVGSLPTNMVLSPDGKFVVVTDSGYREQITVIDSTTGKILDTADFGGGRARTGLYYGLAFGPDGTLYVSRGAEDLITSFTLNTEGKLFEAKTYQDKAPTGSALPNHVAGVAVLGDTLYAVNNQTHTGSDMKGSLSEIDLKTNTIKRKTQLMGFPYGIAVATQGPAKGTVFVANERDGFVSIQPPGGEGFVQMKVGENPTCLTLNHAQTKVYLSNSNSDELMSIDAIGRKLTKTILLRPAGLRGWPGCTPLGIAVSPDDKTGYVAMADLNAVAVVDLDKGALKGYIPVGWYPTSVVVSPDGQRLFVANGKGSKSRNPNGKPVAKLGQYILNIMEGTVSKIDLPAALAQLPQNTQAVVANNRAEPGVADRLAKDFVKPPIDHVIYIVKENRTYDQVLGDVPTGNGDPSICLFPREVTPNLHALAERFVLLDNFYVCAEVSADGWNWSTSGMANEYTSRNTIYNYAGRGRAYDFEGTNNGVAVDLHDLHDVATAPGGYIWDQASRQKISMRNYGMFLTFDSGGDDKRETIYEKDNAPDKKVLMDCTDPYFKRYDTSYADSEAWIKYNLTPAPRQDKTFGKNEDKSRLTAWIRDYNRLVAENKVPKLMLMRLGRDHTEGSKSGQYSARAMVADNDYAVGQVVETVSKSPYWKSTAIFVVEDDAQAGFDHVDAHRSIAFVISPYSKKGTVDSRFYNTDSVLRTMGLLIGLKPWNQYVATAFPFRFFGTDAVNADPYEAILPSKDIVGEINSPEAYRAADSARLIDRYEEESLSDMELNDIMWGAIKGAKTPRPNTPGAIWKTRIGK